MRRSVARNLTIGSAVGYVALWALSPLVTSSTTSDLDLYFWPAAQIAAHGHPLSVYSVHNLGGYPNANGPAGLLPLVPLAAIGDAFGWADDVRMHAALVGVVAGIFALLLAREVSRLISHARGGLAWPLATASVVLLAPVLWISVADYGHFEQVVEVYFLMLAVRFTLARDTVHAGSMLGLSVLARTTALVTAIPFALLALGERRPRQVAGQLSIAAAICIAGIAPFLVADRASVVHSLITYRVDLPIGGGSVWVAAIGTPMAVAARHADSWMILALAATLCALIIWRRPPAATTTAGLCGLLCIVATCFPMLAKTVYPYYLFEPYVLATAWWLARPGNVATWRALVPLALTADVFLAKWNATSPLTGPGPVEGVASSALLAVAVGLVMFDLLRAPEAACSPAVPAPVDPRLGLVPEAV